MRRARAGLVALALALAVTAIPAPGRASAPAWHNWVGTPGDNAGQGVVSRGEAIWSNYLYDDYGANVDGFHSMDPDFLIALLSPHPYPADPTQPVGFAPSGNIGRFRHTGDYSYPPDQSYPNDPANDPTGDTHSYQNGANVTEVRVAADASSVYLRFTLTDLGGDPAVGPSRPDATVIGLAIDPDRAPGGGGPWPYGANVSSAGWKQFLTVWGTGGALTTPGGPSRDLVRDVGGSVREDLAANTMEVRLPRPALGAASTHWRMVAGAGRWDRANGAWAVPVPTTTQSTSPGNLAVYPRLYELPFHHDEPNSLWNETKQANDLHAGTIDSDYWDVDLAQLAAGVSVPGPCSTGPKEQNFVAWSGPGAGPASQKGLVTLPTQNGGAANLHNVNYIYRWQLQPLALVLPPSVCQPAGPRPSLDLHFHPANVNHNAWLVGVEGAHNRVNYINDPSLGFSYVNGLAEKYNRITAAGSGRTEGWNYGDAPGEEIADWNAFQAVASRYNFDPDHVRVTGMSGRLGAPFFAETWPDRVASIDTVSNHDADSPKIQNLRNTPWVFMHGTQFLELQSSLPSYVTLDDHMNSLGYQYLHMTWNGRGHDFNLLNDSYGLVEPWTNPARIHPARITYYLDPKDQRPGVPLFPGVDWVTNLSLRDPGKPALIDVTDRALADRLPQRETRFDCFFANAGTADYVEYHGLSYDTADAVRARMPDRVEAGWTENGCTIGSRQVARPTTANALTGDFQNLSSVTIDARAAGLDLSRPVDTSGVTSHGPLAIHLLSAGRSMDLSLGAGAGLPNTRAAVSPYMVLSPLLVLLAVGLGLTRLRTRGRRQTT